MTETPVQTWDFKPEEILASTRKVQGIFHQPIIDKDGELISPKGMREAVPDFMHLPALHDFHKERPVGLATKVMELPGGRFYFEGVIKSTSDCDDIWEKVKTGNYDQVSIFGKRTKYNNQCALPQNMRSGPCITDGVRLDSISVCDDNARNPQTSLEVKKANVVFDADTFGRRWARNAEGTFVEITKGKLKEEDYEQVEQDKLNRKKLKQYAREEAKERRSEEKKADDEDVEKGENREKENALFADGKEAGWASKKSKKKPKDEEKKAETTSSNLQHASTDYADEKDMEKSVPKTGGKKSVLPHADNLNIHANKHRERDWEERGQYHPTAKHYEEYPKPEPKGVGRDTRSRDGGVDYAGKKVRISKCPCPKEANIISKDVEKADDDEHYKFNEGPQRQVREKRGSDKRARIYPKREFDKPHEGMRTFREPMATVSGVQKPTPQAHHPPAKRAEPEKKESTPHAEHKIVHRGRYDTSQKPEVVNPNVKPPKTSPRSGHAGGIVRVGVAPKSETREIENRTAAAQAIGHYEVEAIRNKYSGNPVAPREGQAKKKVGHRLGTSTRKAGDEMDDMEKGVRPTITEEPIPYKKKEKGNIRPAKEGDKRVEKGSTAQVSDDMGNTKDFAEVEKGSAYGKKGVAEGVKTQTKYEHAPPHYHYKPSRKGMSTEEMMEEMGPDARSSLRSEFKDALGGKKPNPKEWVAKSAADDLEDENYDEDEDKDFKHVKHTDKEGEWSEEGDPNGTVKMKKAQEKGKPEEKDEEEDETEEDEEEDEEVEKGITDRKPYKTVGSYTGHDGSLKDYEVTSSQHERNKGVNEINKKITSTPKHAIQASKEYGKETTATRAADRASSDRRKYQGNQSAAMGMRNLHKGDEVEKGIRIVDADEDDKKTYADHRKEEKPGYKKKKDQIKKGDEDAASESFNPSTVTKGEQMDEQENDVEYVTKALVPIEEIDTIVKARTEEISKAYMGQLDEIKKAYDAKFVELSSKLEKMETETIRKGGQVVVIPELLGGSTGGSMSNADAIARMQAGR